MQIIMKTTVDSIMKAVPPPRVTVLMTVYNGGKYLKSSVESVLNQTFKDFEFLIINDCSTDDSVKMIESFNDKRIIIHHNKKNIGQTKSLNVGLKLARGKYIARMDSDDMAFPTWLEKLISFAESHQEFVVVSAAAAVINESGTFKKIQRTPTTFEGVIFHIFIGNAINHVGSLFNKEIVLKKGGYNDKFKISQDYELWSSLIRNKFRLVNITDMLVAVRVHENSHSYVTEKDRGLMEVAEIIYRNVSSLTMLKISYNDAIKMRVFYRFPHQLTNEEFRNTQNLYINIFNNLKEEFKLEPSFLKLKLKKQMLLPYYRRAIFEIENNRSKYARKMLLNYYTLYGFHVIMCVIFLVTFLDKAIVKRLLNSYESLMGRIITRLFYLRETANKKHGSKS